MAWYKDEDVTKKVKFNEMDLVYVSDIINFIKWYLEGKSDDDKENLTGLIEGIDSLENIRRALVFAEDIKI